MKASAFAKRVFGFGGTTNPPGWYTGIHTLKKPFDFLPATDVPLPPTLITMSEVTDKQDWKLRAALGCHILPLPAWWWVSHLGAFYFLTPKHIRL